MYYGIIWKRKNNTYRCAGKEHYNFYRRHQHDYEILDAIFAVDSHQESFLVSADPNKAFAGVKKQLASKCRALDGDAVIDCEFEYRVAVADGLMSKKQVMEIFAYGTAIRFI